MIPAIARVHGGTPTHTPDMLCAWQTTTERGDRNHTPDICASTPGQPALKLGDPRRHPCSACSPLPRRRKHFLLWLPHGHARLRRLGLPPQNRFHCCHIGDTDLKSRFPTVMVGQPADRSPLGVAGSPGPVGCECGAAPEGDGGGRPRPFTTVASGSLAAGSVDRRFRNLWQRHGGGPYLTAGLNRGRLLRCSQPA